MRLSDVMSHTDLSVFPELAMVLFIAAFAGVLWRVFGRRGAAELPSLASMPLEECPSVECRTHARGEGREVR